MSYRKWMKKWQVVIFWVIAIAFLGGVIWWSVGLYLSSRRSNPNITKESALAYLTKDGTPIENPTYWIFAYEVQTRLNNYESMHKMYYGREMDPVFEIPLYKAMVLDSLMMEKVLIYYADENEIKVDKKDVEKELENLRKKIESNERYVEYVKQNYGGIEKYLDSVKKDVELNLLVNKVKGSVVNVTEEDMKKYFEEHKQEIKNEYETASSSVVVFSDEATALKFVELAKKEGFEKAVKEMSLSPFSYDVKPTTFSTQVTNEIFSAKPGTILGPYSYGQSWVVLKVAKLTKINTYEDFIMSDAFSEIKQKLENEKFMRWYKNYLKKEKLALHINDEELRYWYEYVKILNEPEKKLEFLKNIESIVYPDGEFDESAPDLIKSLYVTLLESEKTDLQNYKLYLSLKEKDKLGEKEKKELESLEKLFGKLTTDDLNKKLNEITEKLKKVVKFLYENYSTAPVVLEKAVNLFPGDPQVVYDYYHYQYETIKPMLSYAKYDQRLYSQVMQLTMGLYSVYMSTKASSDLKFDALYDIYEMYKLLGDATMASNVLNTMKENFPDRLSYDVEFKDLEEMLAPVESSTPATP